MLAGSQTTDVIMVVLSFNASTRHAPPGRAADWLGGKGRGSGVCWCSLGVGKGCRMTGCSLGGVDKTGEVRSVAEMG